MQNDSGVNQPGRYNIYAPSRVSPNIREIRTERTEGERDNSKIIVGTSGWKMDKESEDLNSCINQLVLTAFLEHTTYHSRTHILLMEHSPG